MKHICKRNMNRDYYYFENDFLLVAFVQTILVSLSVNSIKLPIVNYEKDSTLICLLLVQKWNEWRKDLAEHEAITASALKDKLHENIAT